MGLFICLPAIQEDPSKPKPYTYDSNYIKTRSAILKIVQIACILIAFLCAIVAPGWPIRGYGGYNFFSTICQFYMWGVIFFFLGSAFNIKPYYQRWPLWEFIFYLIATISLTIGSIVAAALSINSSLTAAAVFGFFSVVLYGIGAFTNYQDWKAVSDRASDVNDV